MLAAELAGGDGQDMTYSGLERLRRFVNPWTEALAEDGLLHLGDRTAIAVIELWFACVVIAIWMAVGQPPRWLSGPATTFLWIPGVIYFLCGLPILIVPFHSLWAAVRERAAEKDCKETSRSEFEEDFERRRSWAKAGLMPGVRILDPKRTGIVHRFFGGLVEIVFHPPLRLQIGGIALIIALYSAGHVWLASAYAAPAVGWYAAEANRWSGLLQRKG